MAIIKQNLQIEVVTGIKAMDLLKHGNKSFTTLASNACHLGKSACMAERPMTGNSPCGLRVVADVEQEHGGVAIFSCDNVDCWQVGRAVIKAAKSLDNGVVDYATNLKDALETPILPLEDPEL